jgi:hypothetical protein
MKGSQHGTGALQMLGKLGGRNRHFLIEPATLSYRSVLEDGLTLRFVLPAGSDGHPSASISPEDDALAKAFHVGLHGIKEEAADGVVGRDLVLPMDQIIDLAKQLLIRETHSSIQLWNASPSTQVAPTISSHLPSTDHLKQQSFLFLRACALSMMDLNVHPTLSFAQHSESSLVPPAHTQSATASGSFLSSPTNFQSATMASSPGSSSSPAGNLFEGHEDLTSIRTRMLRCVFIDSASFNFWFCGSLIWFTNILPC